MAECPPDPQETAEDYALGLLTPADEVAFEEHLLVCANCRAAVEFADVYTRSMTSAAHQLRGDKQPR